MANRDLTAYGIPEDSEESRHGEHEFLGWMSEYRRDGVLVARVEFHGNGMPSYVEPFDKGVQHGTARQFANDGRLLSEAEFVAGNGWDLWAYDSGALCESREFKAGSWDGLEQWWHDTPELGDTRVYIERHFRAGVPHGLEREWELDDPERLKTGYPKFWVRGVEVTREVYETTRAEDPTLPSYDADEDRPARETPAVWRAWKAEQK